MQYRRHIGLETRVIALIIGVMTGRMTTGHSLSTEGATVAIGIEDLVVFSIEATIIGMTGMAGRAINSISNMVMGGGGSPFRQYGYRNNNHGYTYNSRGRGSSSGRYARRQGYQRYNNNYRGRQSWGQNIDQNRQQYGYDNNYFTHTERNYNVNSSDPRGQSCNNGLGLSDLRSFGTNEGVSFSAQQNSQHFQ